MKRNVLLLFIAMSTLTVCAQSNFRKGYVITLQQDTLHGFVDFRADQTNVKLCRFKQNTHGEVVTYLPGSITGYRFVEEGKFYVSKVVELDKVQHTYFLEYLIQGLKNLYYLPLGNGYFYFEDADGAMVSITKAPDAIVDYRVKEDVRYKGMLNYVFRDYLPLSEATAKAGFDKASMIKITKEYHERVCDTGEPCIIFEHDYKRSFVKVDFSASAGIELQHFRLYDEQDFDAYSLSPVLTAGIHISSPRLLKSLYYNLHGSVSGVALALDYPDYFQRYCRFGYNALATQLTAGLEYIYDKGRIRPAVSAGMAGSWMLNPKRSYQKNYYDAYGGPTVAVSQYNPIAGVGLDIQQPNDRFITLRLLLTYHPPEMYGRNSFQLKVGYKF